MQARPPRRRAEPAASAEALHARRAGTRGGAAALAQVQGNISHAAKLLGISRAALVPEARKTWRSERRRRRLAAVGCRRCMALGAALQAGQRRVLPRRRLCCWRWSCIRRGSAAAAPLPPLEVPPMPLPARWPTALLALESQLEHAPVALFRIDPAPATSVAPVNASARRLLAPGRATRHRPAAPDAGRAGGRPARHHRFRYRTRHRTRAGDRQRADRRRQAAAPGRAAAGGETSSRPRRCRRGRSWCMC